MIRARRRSLNKFFGIIDYCATYLVIFTIMLLGVEISRAGAHALFGGNPVGLVPLLLGTTIFWLGLRFYVAEETGK